MDVGVAKENVGVMKTWSGHGMARPVDTSIRPL